MLTVSVLRTTALRVCRNPSLRRALSTRASKGGRRALLSVSNKEGLPAFATQLHALGYELLSTGGTASLLRAEGIPVKDVAAVTGFPEILGGRVKTLHPLVHGGLLGRGRADEEEMKAHSIEPIDLLVSNLYPFAQTVADPDVSLEQAVENIDIGGPTMLRAAAKNHAHVAAVVDPEDYEAVAAALKDQGEVPLSMRRSLALRAFAHTAQYDATIAGFLSSRTEFQQGEATQFPEEYTLGLTKAQSLRYGENPHQQAAFYSDGSGRGVAGATQVQGKALSYNNIADADAALDCAHQFQEPACVIVKHANPCGVAVADTILQAYDRAFETDPTSAFGGIIAFNRPLDADTAKAIVARQFVEVILAPSLLPGTAEVLAPKKNVRVLVGGKEAGEACDMKRVQGGLLLQTRDDRVVTEADLSVATDRAPTPQEIADLLFAWQVVKYVKSNAIVYCKDGMTIGVGAGQMSRVYSARIAAIKARDAGLAVEGSVMASDAFFPFRDGIDSAAEQGVTAIIQPGGSVKDKETIKAANEHGIAMVFTGVRHFRH